MKICIDGIGISLLQGTGLYSYTYDLLDNLFEMYPQPEYEIICDEAIDISNWQKNRRISQVDLNLIGKENKNEIIKEHMLENKIDIFHSPNNGFSTPPNIGKNKKYKSVITLHDVIAESNSSLVDSKYLSKFRQVFPAALENTDKIVAVSNFIKNELFKFYNVPRSKIEVIYPGCGQQFKYIDYEKSRDFLKNTYNIDGNIILFAGSLHIRKNLKSIMHIFKDISGIDSELKLIIAGKNDGKRYGHYLELKQLANALELEDRVIFTGTVDYNHMPYFYNSAKCIVNLSDYEGFPMSSIEALCCGTPVICSNTTSFKETVGDYGLLIDNNSEKELKDAVLGVLYDRGYRKEVIENSRHIREKYNWSRAIRKYVRLYEELAFEDF